ncbi:MAG: GRAM domain-containing protein [Candidatus Bathyarchaeota archaeon]|nr:GRAM domain-containing protein [Candidatus Bathyarchaeota archaeon]
MVLLKPGEKLLLQDRASLEGHGKGTVYLTNTRLIFEVSTGLISKKTQIALVLGFGTIEDVRVEGLIGKKLAVQGSDERTGVIDKYKFSVPNPSAWEVAIKSAVQGS